MHLSGTSNDCVNVEVVSGVSTGNPSTSGRDSLVDPSGVSIDNRVSFGGKNRVCSHLNPVAESVFSMNSGKLIEELDVLVWQKH